MPPRAISLFCGAGGCSLGFKQSGYDILYASDIEQVAVDTYIENFPETKCICEDINEVDFEDILALLGLSQGELDILIGGPPCQGFSTAGMRFWDDPRNSLLKNYISALQVIRPKWFLMENVEGLLTANQGEYVYEAVKAFVALGYQVRVEKIYSQEYGIPQRRKRVFIVGNRLGIKFKMPEPTIKVKGKIFRNSDITLRHTIGTLPEASIDSSYNHDYLNVEVDKWEEYLRGDSCCVTDHFMPKLNNLQVERIHALKPGQTMKDLPKHLQHDSFKRRSNRRVMDGTPTEKRGGSPSGLKRLVYDEPSLTITGAATREFIHPVKDRPLTIRETARIQTFTDDFVFSGNTAQKIQQIGNAIPPILARIFADHIRDDFGYEVQGEAEGSLLGFSLTKATAMSPALKRTNELLMTISNNNDVNCQKELF